MAGDFKLGNNFLGKKGVIFWEKVRFLLSPLSCDIRVAPAGAGSTLAGSWGPLSLQKRCPIGPATALGPQAVRGRCTARSCGGCEELGSDPRDGASPWAPAGRLGRTRGARRLLPGQERALGSSWDPAAGIGRGSSYGASASGACPGERRRTAWAAGNPPSSRTRAVLLRCISLPAPPGVNPGSV